MGNFREIEARLGSMRTSELMRVRYKANLSIKDANLAETAALYLGKRLPGGDPHARVAKAVPLLIRAIEMELDRRKVRYE